MPPRIPPELLVLKPSTLISSLFSDPRIVTTSAPTPISKAFTAFTLITAFASSASSFENTGAPRPGPTPFTFIKIFAPIESCASMRFLKNCSSSEIFPLSVKKKLLLYTSSRLILSAQICPICTTPPRTSIPNIPKVFLAIAPAATLITVSRALALPPPL